MNLWHRLTTADQRLKQHLVTWHGLTVLSAAGGTVLFLFHLLLHRPV